MKKEAALTLYSTVYSLVSLNKLQSMKYQLCMWKMRITFFAKNDGKYVDILNSTDFLSENDRKYISFLNGTNFLDTLYIFICII